MKKRKTPYGVSPSQEAFIPLPSGNFFVFENAEFNPTGTSYVRVVDPKGGEVAYWCSDEWSEEDGAQFVMGAICGAMLAKERAKSKWRFYQFAPDCEFPKGVRYTKYGN